MWIWIIVGMVGNEGAVLYVNMLFLQVIEVTQVVILVGWSFRKVEVTESGVNGSLCYAILLMPTAHCKNYMKGKLKVD